MSFEWSGVDLSDDSVYGYQGAGGVWLHGMTAFRVVSKSFFRDI